GGGWCRRHSWLECLGAKVPADLRNCSGKTQEHLHYCLSRYGIVSTTSLALWPCPHGEKGSISSTQANAVDSRLGLLGPGSGQRRLAQNLIQDFASLSMRPRTLGSLMNEGGRHSRFRDSRRPMARVHTAAFMQPSP